ncbi:hypothetical protein ES705_36568 [subsurface metagenome]
MKLHSIINLNKTHIIMKKILLITLGLFLVLHVSAQKNSEIESKPNEFGIHVGATTGMGLSYRRWIGPAGIQLTALPIITDDYNLTSLGVTALYSLKETKYIRVYLYIGNHLLIRNDKVAFTYSEEYNIGIGPAFSFGRPVAFNIMFGYGLYDVLNNVNMFPTGEMGLYFKF